MKKKHSYSVTCMMLVTLFVGNLTYSNAQIANSHQNDIGIENDSDVVFTEMFEQSKISDMINASGYQTSKMLSHILFDSSVPPGSLGSQSCKLRTVEQSNSPSDTSEDSNILKKFTTGISDSVFVRYYVKYNNAFTFHHSGVWIGGTNTNYGCWPCSKSNTLASGDSAFRVGSEVRGATKTPQNNAKFGFFNYWMGQHSNDSGIYLANEFHNSGINDVIDMNSWNCIEVMVKLNNPVSASNGELILWVNGVKVSHHGYHFPSGSWDETHFTEGAGSPFEGFQWRSNPAVVFNYIWIKNYSTYNTSTAPNDILYDHVVVAKKYIGPISTSPSTVSELNKSHTLQVHPNPANSSITFTEMLANVDVLNVYGQVMLSQRMPVQSISIAELADGVYFLRANNLITKFVVKH